MICRRSHRHVKILFENANVGSISCSLFIVLIWHLWWNRGQVLHFLQQVKTYMYMAHLWSPKPTNYSTWTDKKGVKNVKKSNGMSSNKEGKKKVHFSTAVSKRGVSDLRNDRKDHTIPRVSPLFPHYADNVGRVLSRVFIEKRMIHYFNIWQLYKCCRTAHAWDIRTITPI